MRWATWTLGFALLATGCVGDDATPTDPATAGPGEGEEGTPFTIEGPPAWNVGDFWSFGGADADSWGWTSVVTDISSGEYILGTDEPVVAFYDAREGVSFMGKQRMSDLAGSQSGGRVQWLQWPLVDGAVWSMNLDGETVQVTATADPPGMRMDARLGGAPFFSYRYDPEVKWFSEFARYGPDGSPRYEQTLSRSGENWTGELVTYQIELFNQLELSGPQALPPTTYTMPTEGWDDLWLDFEFSCSEPGGVAFAVGPAESAPDVARENDASPGHSTTGPCPHENELDDLIATAPFEGTWGHTYQSTSADAYIDFTLYLRKATTTPFAP